MTCFTSILADVDALAPAHPVFDRAIELARRCGARLKLVDVACACGRMEAAERRTRLARLAASAPDLKIDVDVLSGRPAQALVDEVIASGHDLVIRSHARDLVARPKALGTVDMQLFRCCPCAVWAVGPGAAAPPQTVLAAIHADPSDPQEQRLNVRILETAVLMASVARARLIVFEAWHAFAEDMLRAHYSPADLAAYVRAYEDSARTNLQRFVDEQGEALKHARVELRKGTPEDAVTEFVVAEGVDLVVMGSIARRGLAGLIMGNTAERLLQRLPCSVVAVKPEPAAASLPVSTVGQRAARWIV